MAKRLRKMRKEVQRRRGNVNRRKRMNELFTRQERINDRNTYNTYFEGPKEKNTIQFKRTFIFRTMLASCLLLLVIAIFNMNNPQVNQIKGFVNKVYEQEFQFATIAHWYESQFGRPLTLVPMKDEVIEENRQHEAEMVYALPVNGVIQENFETNGHGVLIQTESNANVEAVRGGYVIRVGESDENEDLGKMVVIQHYDGAESVYGMLDKIEVNVYDHIETGRKLGTVSASTEEEKGIFYFALKEGENYINPSEVLSFD